MYVDIIPGLTEVSSGKCWVGPFLNAPSQACVEGGAGAAAGGVAAKAAQGPQVPRRPRPGWNILYFI